MESINTFLFDFDGTIFDSRKAMVNVFHELCRRYSNRKYTLEELDAEFATSFRSVAKTFDPVSGMEIQKVYYELMMQEEETHAHPFEGMPDLLFDLKSMGYKIGLVTNKEKILVIKSLRKYNLFHLFNCIVTFDDVTLPKPDAEPVNKALSLLNAVSYETIMIGDTIFDVKAAHAAGVDCVVLDWYNRYFNGEAAQQAGYHCKNCKELMMLICREKKAI